MTVKRNKSGPLYPCDILARTASHNPIRYNARSRFQCVSVILSNRKFTLNCVVSKKYTLIIKYRLDTDNI